ncbi:MAG: urease accessory protein UreE [Halochromatium sp.]|nr:urease accessory protein UreE [Halochromatium sp.]
MQLRRRIEAPARIDGGLSLSFEQRSRSRLRARLDDGREVGILLPRGERLRDGDLLADEQGEVIQIRAAAEPISCAEADDPLLLMRAAYHLGNRHVALQIEPGRLCWLHDHVLDAMVSGLGLSVSAVQAPFEPEAGAYGGAAIGHKHGHGHGHGHEHQDGHEHEHTDGNGAVGHGDGSRSWHKQESPVDHGQRR